MSSESDDDNNGNESFASSVGVSLNLPSGSLKTSIKDQRKALKVVSVFPRSEAAFKAVLDLVSVCKAIEAQLEQISFQRLDFGELCALDQFYTADIVIVDASQVKEQPTLFYHLGIRESFGMKDNVVIVHDDDETKTSSIQVLPDSPMNAILQGNPWIDTFSEFIWFVKKSPQDENIFLKFGGTFLDVVVHSRTAPQIEYFILSL